MLKVENVTVKYKNNTVIQDLSYIFPENRVIGIIGASGIGKTTLLNVLAGLITPTSGTVSRPERISYVFQEPRLFPWMTALENVTTVCADKERASALLKDLLPAPEATNKYPNELSGGMKQRVSIARSLAYDGEIYFLDEPFRGLDLQTKQETTRTFFEAVKGKTVIMVTHDEEDLAFCDVILRMNDSPVTELLLEKSNKEED